MSGSSGPVLFLAVRAVDDREHLRSVVVSEALIRIGRNAIILPSLDEDEVTVRTAGSWVVPLFDDNYNVNRWSPRETTERWTPGWVLRLSSSKWCIAVGKPCITLPPEAIDSLAIQMARRFSPSNETQEQREREDWGPPRKEKTYSVTGRQLPTHGWHQPRLG